MHTVSPPAKILVTGANGFLGLWQVSELLNRGYVVRGTVRSTDKGEAVKALLREKQPAVADRFEYVVVPNIVEEGAFDDAVKGVDAIIHGASPITTAQISFKELVRPAIGGTMSILKSALHHGQTLKRIVLTASIVCMMRSDAPPGVYTEADWNDHAVNEVERLGKEAPAPYKYQASKVLAERAAWEFYNVHKRQVPWDITTVAPAFTFGPLPNDPHAPEAMVTTLPLLWISLFKTTTPTVRVPPYFNYVDVRDVIEAHMRALEVEAAGGERIMVTAQAVTWQDWRNAAKDLNLLPLLQKEDPDTPQGPFPIVSNEKSKQILNLQYRPLADTVKDIIDDFTARGWLAHLGA
ncbi:NAD(P)-binding protein [Trametes punicea]|nr:NAD(P)-binding protein [Trametes punicea]